MSLLFLSCLRVQVIYCICIIEISLFRVLYLVSEGL